ncbi:MAG: Rieske 2Fe-2S domain-containing protein [Pirellulales bacterium]|nr:Rieske 2Fe-2S domain-containing protein [Pirellulales bacterium]
MAEKKKLSVAEILAAARKADSGGATAASESPATSPADVAPAEPAEVSAEAAVESTPAETPAPTAPKPATTGTPGKRPSVADILAAARQKQAPGAAAPAAKPAAAKPAAKPPGDKPANPAAKPAAGEAAPRGSGVKDTASILAAARGGNKPGPISKAEAAALTKPAAPARTTEKTKLAVPPMPAKPQYAATKPGEKKAVETEERRGFLGAFFGAFMGSFLGLGFSSLAATNALWGLGTARFMFPNVLIEPPSTFKVGPPTDFPPGAVSEKFKAQFGVWVVNGEYNGQQQLYAIRTVCTHLGCTPNWLEGEQKFKCPCHGSGFYKDGVNFEGPAPRPLERYAIRLADDGQLEIDKSKKFQEELGQWRDPSCFVVA